MGLLLFIFSLYPIKAYSLHSDLKDNLTGDHINLKGKKTLPVVVSSPTKIYVVKGTVTNIPEDYVKEIASTVKTRNHIQKKEATKTIKQKRQENAQNKVSDNSEPVRMQVYLPVKRSSSYIISFGNKISAAPRSNDHFKVLKLTGETNLPTCIDNRNGLKINCNLIPVLTAGGFGSAVFIRPPPYDFVRS